jgi:hypothetical protein
LLGAKFIEIAFCEHNTSNSMFCPRLDSQLTLLRANTRNFRAEEAKALPQKLSLNTLAVNYNSFRLTFCAHETGKKDFVLPAKIMASGQKNLEYKHDSN